MIGTTLIALVLSAPLPLTPSASGPSGPRLDAAEFSRLRRDLVPSGQEAWLSIDWYTDLLAARDVAAGTNRPLFLWAMNGHPIGAS